MTRRPRPVPAALLLLAAGGLLAGCALPGGEQAAAARPVAPAPPAGGSTTGVHPLPEHSYVHPFFVPFEAPDSAASGVLGEDGVLSPSNVQPPTAPPRQPLRAVIKPL